MAKNAPDLSRFIETEPDKYIKVYKKGEPGHREYGKVQPAAPPPIQGGPEVEIASVTAGPPKIPHGILGACGEYYVAAYLSGMGLVVALTRGGAPATDLLVTSQSGGRAISVQVKTGGEATRDFYKRKTDKNGWIWNVGAKAIGLASPYHWYAMVYAGGWPRTGDPAIPKIFFIPSKIVADALGKQEPRYEDWFCILDKSAEQYCGEAGYGRLKDAVAAQERGQGS